MRYDHFSMLPEKAFQPRNGRFGMTLEGGKGGGGSPAPDPNIGIAQRELAEISKEYLNSWKTEVWPTLKEESQKQTARADEQFALDKAIQENQIKLAEEGQARYREYGYPLQEAIFKEAQAAGGEVDQARQAALALGDVRQATDRAAKDVEMQQRSYGIDPTSGRYQGMRRATAVDTSALEAAAANRARAAAEQLGWAKKMDAVALSQGQFGNQATSTGLALNAGNQALQSGQIPIQNAGAMSASMGGAYGGAMQGWNQVGSLGVQKYQADVDAYKAQQAANSSSSSGFGSMIGTLGAAAIKNPGIFASDRRLKKDIQFVEQLENGINVYAFEYKDEYKDVHGHGVHYGFMADEIEQVIPEAVVTMADGYKAVNYGLVLEHK